MKKRRFIAAITALMCAGTVFVPNMAVKAAAETQTSAVQTNFPDSMKTTSALRHISLPFPKARTVSMFCFMLNRMKK